MRGGVRVDKYDLTPAEKFGELSFCLGDDADPSDARITGLLDGALVNFRDADYLLLVGNPALIGLAFAIAGEYNDGRVKVLQWSGRDGDYKPLQMQF
jgi:hypothetical protein